jgi:thymidylate kinase
MILGFSGVDYSGKSTQIGMVQSKYGFFVVWSRFGYTPSILFLKAFLRKIFSTINKDKKKNLGDQSLKVNESVFDIWFWTAVIDYFIFGLYLHWVKKVHKKLVFDRYILDALVDIAVRYGGVNWRCTVVKKIYDCIFPKPDHYLFLDIDCHRAGQRRVEKNDPYPVSDIELEKLRQMYFLFLSDMFKHDVEIIDASGSADDLHEKITRMMVNET